MEPTSDLFFPVLYAVDSSDLVSTKRRSLKKFGSTFSRGFDSRRWGLDQGSAVADFGRVFGSQRADEQNLGRTWRTSTKLSHMFGLPVCLEGRRGDEVLEDFGEAQQPIVSSVHYSSFVKVE